MKIGILALQGDVAEHKRLLRRLNVNIVDVRMPDDLEEVDGLIIPGGESTTISKLINKSGLYKPIINKYRQGMPIYGTCAGAIILAKYVLNQKVPTLEIMDISIKRNDYGRQIESFEAELDSEIGKIRGVFIRAPVIDKIHDGVKILSKFEGKPVLARQRNLLVSTFHPELTKNDKVHRYFLDIVEKAKEKRIAE
jgi:5'-phosphate synthase pdxT subunit